MDRAEIEDLIRKSYAARQREDGEGTARCFADEAVFRIVANDRVGDIGKPLKGLEQLKATWKTLFRTWDWSDFPIASIVIDQGVEPAKAVVHCKGTIVHTPSGEGFAFETMDMLTIADGKIVEFLEFFDTDRLVQIAGGTRPASP